MAADSGSAARAGVKARMVLHLGVIVQPYRSSGKGVRAMTTADVAKILEAKYEIMKTFERVHRKDVRDALIASAQQGLKALLSGERVAPFAEGCGVIRSMFQDFIHTQEAERVGIPGTPTKAAIMGINHRRSDGKVRRGPRRPSFRDSTLYVDSFDAWVDD